MYHSHKKRKDGLEGSLDRVWSTAELEFPKILVRRLPQHTWDVNIKYAGSLEWSNNGIIYMGPAYWSTDNVNFMILILICF